MNFQQKLDVRIKNVLYETFSWANRRFTAAKEKG